MASLKDIFSLRGRADAQWRSYGLQAEGDDETRRLTIDTTSWTSVLTDEALADVRTRWNLELADWQVSFHCKICGLRGDNEGDAYETSLRVTQERGVWADLAPSNTSILIPGGYDRYRVRIWADASVGVLSFVDGIFENGGALVALGPTSPGKMFWPGHGVTLFVHWVGKDRPGFVTLAVRFDGKCPV